MSITIREVAEEAGVSQATAARALSGYGTVSGESRSRVLAAAQRLGYRPNRVAQALRLGQTRTVGFVPGDIENPFFATITRQLGDTLEDGGYTLLVASSDERVDRERKIIETLRANLVSGVVIAPTSQQDAAHLERLQRDGVPVVLVDRHVDGLGVDAVEINNEEAGHEAVSHLIGLGHRRIGILADDLQLTSNSARFNGYHRALQEHGIELDPQLIGVSGPGRQEAVRLAVSLLTLRDRPTAMLAADNFMTEAVLHASRECGYAIPADLSLVGFDNFNLTSFVSPAVTAISQPVNELGQIAGKMMLERLGGLDSEPRRVRLPAELVIRESTAPPAKS